MSLAQVIYIDHTFGDLHRINLASFETRIENQLETIQLNDYGGVHQKLCRLGIVISAGSVTSIFTWKVWGVPTKTYRGCCLECEGFSELGHCSYSGLTALMIE